LEDCISVHFKDHDFGAYLRDNVQSRLNIKRLYKLVHIVLFGCENILQQLLRGQDGSGGNSGDGDSGGGASSPPGKLAKRGAGGGTKITGGAKGGKEYANLIEKFHLIKVTN
jgi:hypothetical protein